mmetsp:Transcript_13866/g.32318  ORF Transcript_13866/g.32318 Transcript_13866/m.32318 type:complete len:97 (-) Transcript_13866:1416-1706(-)
MRYDMLWCDVVRGRMKPIDSEGTQHLQVTDQMPSAACLIVSVSAYAEPIVYYGVSTPISPVAAGGGAGAAGAPGRTLASDRRRFCESPGPPFGRRW